MSWHMREGLLESAMAVGAQLARVRCSFKKERKLCTFFLRRCGPTIKWCTRSLCKAESPSDKLRTRAPASLSMLRYIQDHSSSRCSPFFRVPGTFPETNVVLSMTKRNTLSWATNQANTPRSLLSPSEGVLMILVLCFAVRTGG